MFVEFICPRVVDNMSTRDRIKIRFGAMENGPNLWCTLVFKTREEAVTFLNNAIKVVLREESKSEESST